MADLCEACPAGTGLLDCMLPSQNKIDVPSMPSQSFDVISLSAFQLVADMSKILFLFVPSVFLGCVLSFDHGAIQFGVCYLAFLGKRDSVSRL